MWGQWAHLEELRSLGAPSPSLSSEMSVTWVPFIYWVDVNIMQRSFGVTGRLVWPLQALRSPRFACRAVTHLDDDRPAPPYN